MADNWSYVDDWRGRELFQYSNYTLNEGEKVGKSGKGDCDDFAILMASLIESIGGTSRIIFAYGAAGGHAYCEVYLGKCGDKNLERILSWLKKEYSTDEINIHSNLETDEVWLNMDWWKDGGGAKHPGGPFYKSKTHIPLYIQEDIEKKPLTPIENQLPVARFSYDPVQPLADGAVSFNALQSNDPDGNITNYEWDFGDGESARGAMKSLCRHFYSIPGKLQVNLTVTDNEGDKSSRTIDLVVSEPLPEAKITYSPSYPKVGVAITFDSSQSKGGRGNITSYEWDFGDGYFGKRDSIDHVYWKSGTYNVELIVTNDKGIKGSSIIAIFVDLKENATELADKGKAFYDQGKYDEAIQAYDEAINLDHNNATTWANKGMAFFAQGKYDETILAYNEAIKLDPNDGSVWNNKGTAHDFQGNFEEAAQAYDEATKLEPRDAFIWNNKGLALKNQGKYDEAIQSFDKAINIIPGSIIFWINKGGALYEQGKYDEALKAYDEVIRLDPTVALAWNNKGIALKALGKSDEADAAFASAKELGYSS